MDRLFNRFASKVKWPSAPTACWEWNGSFDRHGYGKLHIGRRLVGAHRVAYELLRGPIPEGLHIDHLCRVRSCVNPMHMEAVTMETNTLRGNSPQAVNARKSECSSGHAFTAANTYRWTDRRGRVIRTCRTCRAEASRRHKARTARAVSA